MNAPKLKPVQVEQHDGGATTAKYRVSCKADMLALIKKATRFYVHARLDAYLHSTEDQYKPGYFRSLVEVTRSSAERAIDDMMSHSAAHDNEYCNARLYTYYLPGRWNRTTQKEGAPRRRVTLYIG